MKKYTFSITFETDDSWEPASQGCQFFCPLRILARFNQFCKGSKYRRACPFIKYGIKEV